MKIEISKLAIRTISYPYMTVLSSSEAQQSLRVLGERPYAYQLVGEVKAHQGDDG